MESGKRRVPERVARAVVGLFRLPPTALPLAGTDRLAEGATDARVERALAKLRYPGLAYRKRRGVSRHPADLLLMALALDELDPRLAEALPWLLLRFERFDVPELVARARALNVVNRLGFTAALARELSDQNPAYRHRCDELRRLEEALEPLRLAREDTYGRKEGSSRMRAWLRANRSAAAQHWNLLTDLKPEHLSYAQQDPGAVAQLPSSR
jgi:hypothetical protein